MIELIKHMQNRVYIQKNGEIEWKDTTVMSVIRLLCIEHLVTYEGYIKAVQFKYHKKQRIPVVLSDEIGLIPMRRVRDYENIWINLYAIKSITPFDSGTKITFFSHETLITQKRIENVKEQIEFAKMIQNEKVKHFHSYSYRK